VCLIKPDRAKLNASFLKYYIQSRHGFEQITGKMTGTAIKRIILKTIKAATIPLPNVAVQKECVQQLDTLYQETKLLESIYQKKLTALTELKQSILQKAFTGELTQSPEQELAEVC
jgi:type I restriction enzyme S subunit